MLLVCSLVAPSAPVARARPLNAGTVHSRILKRGVGNWVAVELQNGTAFTGRVIRIDEQSFGMQLHNDPAITPVQYSDVVGLHMGLSARGLALMVFGAGMAGTVAIALLAHHEMAKFPTMPGEPTQPVFP
jgi:hypothetical protein